MPSSPDSSSDSSGGSTPAALDGPNLEAENCLPGVVSYKVNEWFRYYRVAPKMAKMTKCPNFILNILINKQYHVKVLLKRFHWNCNTRGFHPQTQKLVLRTKYIAPCDSTAEEVLFEW